MLKNKPFPASIFKGFGPRFGRVFHRFFGTKRRAKSDLKKSVRQAKSIGKTNTKSMSALLRQRFLRAKVAEKSHVCWDIVFGGILEGFWEGFGKPITSIFAFFSLFFRSKFWKTFWKGKKSKTNGQQDDEGPILRPGRRNVRGPGER